MLSWLPAATRDPHGRVLAWTETTAPKGCLHTTESAGVPSYRDWLDAPHATVIPNPGVGVTVRQHIPFTRASFALRHTREQPTNTDYVFQFELVGTSDPRSPIKGAYLWPAADDAVLLDLYHTVIKPLDDAFVIPLHAPAFLAYPSSAGQTSVRLTDAQFDVYAGWLGHQHVPQNDHGDPGSFPWARMLALAGATPKPPPRKATIHGPVRYGDTDATTGGSVSAIQHRLDRQLGVSVAIDGDFGRATQREVIAWQTKHRSACGTADGVVGPRTAASLGFLYRGRTS